MCVVRRRFFSSTVKRQWPLRGVLVDGPLVRGRSVFDVPLQAMVQQAAVRPHQEGAAAAGHVEDAERGPGFAAGEINGALAFDLLADGVEDDVVHDVGGGVIDAAGLAHFGFFFDLGLMPGGQTDDLAQEALIHRT